MTIRQSTTDKISELARLAEEGISQKEAALRSGIHPSRVSALARENGIQFQHGNIREADARAHRMAAMYRAGSTLEQIGQIYCISRERVRQILTKHFDINRLDGGQYKLLSRKRESLAIEREAKLLAKCGCTVKEYRDLIAIGREMRSRGYKYYRTPVGAYIAQRSNAAKRGIGWHLSLRDWWQVWQDSEKWSLRGRGRYVMCRHGDVGPYALGNVFIGTSAENATSRKNNKRTLPTGVLPSRGGNYVAKRCISGKQTHLGTFPTAEAAHAAYLAAEPEYLRVAS